MKRLFGFGLVLFLFSSPGFTATSDNPVPSDLAPWSDWVLRDTPEVTCPILYNSNDHFCAYPAILNLDLQSSKGAFEQRWSILQTSWIDLPGGIDHWPQQVVANQKPVVVINRNGRPSVELKPGEYTIQGKFLWNELPKSILVPVNTGLIHLLRNGQKIEQPDFRQGQLWLNAEAPTVHENNRLDVQVFRKLSDSIPVQLTTSIVLDISGQQREIQLTGSLLENFVPAAIRSQLPARIDNKGILHIQVRPGHWVIDVDGINLNNINVFSLGSFTSPWPEQEIWAFEQQPHLRLVKISNKQSIDPNQTQLPEDWKNLPAYIMNQGDTLNLDVIKRGHPDPEPDQLNLKRILWLDFNGLGWTVKDAIQGTLSANWRLNAQPESILGQVTLDGEPQYITRLPDQNLQGVEIRQGVINLEADSRINGDLRDISASGWDSPFNRVTAELNLPVGYKLIAISGAHAPASWINQWTLLDLFMVLITSIAVFRLFGKTWGVIALATLSFTWHETAAPQYIWLNLIIAIALLKALSEGKLQRWIGIYRHLTSLVLVILLLGFSVIQVRTAIYPQLEKPGINAPFRQAEVREQAAQAPVPMSKSEIMSSSLDRYMAPYEDEQRSQKLKREPMMTVDPNAMIQTGPGLPNWQWHQYSISWDGPVNQQQRIQLTLMNPFMHRVFNILSIVLLVSLAWRLIDVAAVKSKINSASKPLSAFGVMLLLSFAITAIPEPAQAAFPSAAMLKDLQNHLSKPKDCLPSCASIESLNMTIGTGTLKMSLKVHAKEELSLPLPVPVQKWTPRQVMIDGVSASGLFRYRDQNLWIHIKPGTHTINIEGRVNHLNQITIDFPLKPHAINVQATDWSYDGMDQSISAVNAITFTRADDKDASDSVKTFSSDLPVFAEVTRNIELGLDWALNTHVQIQSGTALPTIIRIPLMQGESVITDGIKVENGFVVVTLNQNNRQAYWRSTLAPTDTFKMTSGHDPAYREIWQLNVSPIWHVTYEGIPVIYHQREGQQWLPEWQPWADENVVLHITRPEGVPGKTLTIENSQLTLTPGEQITTAELKLNLRSSLGGQHALYLPADIELLNVSMNGNNLPIRITDGALALPISPGQHAVIINWRESRGIGLGQFKTSEVNLGNESVNARLTIKPGNQRWVLFAGGPLLGPAVLFWGVMLVIVLIAIGLSRVKDMPLSMAHWILLGIGLSTTTPEAAVLVAGWLFALRWRNQATMPTHTGKFNLIQIGLVLLTYFALTTLFVAVQQGLLGSPDMQIEGNYSSSYQLNWFSDRSDNVLPQAWIITVPVMAYRILMLLWSIWLAFALISWLRWGWSCYVKDGYWRSWPKWNVRGGKDKEDKTSESKSW